MKNYEIDPYAKLIYCEVMPDKPIGSHTCTRHCEHASNFEKHQDYHGRINLITFTCNAKTEDTEI